MSLADIISEGLAEKLSELSLSEVSALVRASSLGLGPKELFNGIQTVSRGEDFALPGGGGRPKPLVVQAWSFVKDRGQYHDTYQLSSAKAGELTDLLRTDLEAGIKEITLVVTTHLRARGSTRPVSVTAMGLPVQAGAERGVVASGGVGRAALKDEIRKDGAMYGLYKFEAEDTGRTGGTRFRVSLGGGLYATHPSKQGAVDVARICRVKGRSFPLIEDRIAFWLEGSSPHFGADFPAKVTFTGKLAPSGEVPAVPVARAKTVAPSPGRKPTTSGEGEGGEN